MGDKIKKIIIATTSLNLHDVVGFVVKADTLVVYTVSETLYFNAPEDISSAESAFDELTLAYDELQVKLEEEEAAQLEYYKNPPSSTPPIEPIEPETD